MYRRWGSRSKMFMSIFDIEASCWRCCSRRRSMALVLLGEDGDYVVAFGWGHSLSRMRLTVNLVLHKEMSLLLEVDITVCAGVAFGVTKLVSQLHHRSAEIQIRQVLQVQTKFTLIFFFLNHRSCVLQWSSCCSRDFTSKQLLYFHQKVATKTQNVTPCTIS